MKDGECRFLGNPHRHHMRHIREIARREPNPPLACLRTDHERDQTRSIRGVEPTGAIYSPAPKLVDTGQVMR